MNRREHYRELLAKHSFAHDDDALDCFVFLLDDIWQAATAKQAQRIKELENDVDLARSANVIATQQRLDLIASVMKLEKQLAAKDALLEKMDDVLSVSHTYTHSMLFKSQVDIVRSEYNEMKGK